MAELSEPEEGMGETISLPPRQETVFARYTRLSKLAAVGLSLIGIVAASYTFSQLLSKDDAAATAGHHVSKINSADNQESASTAMSTAEDVGMPASTTKATGKAEALNQQDDRSVPMATAPMLELTENTPQGDLPRISEDGRQPWQIYARPFNAADQRPRLAILVADLGLSRTITEAAVSRLPSNVTLAFDVQSPVIGSWCSRARQEGHEVLLSVPMEPFDFPRSDPGAHTLLTTIPNSANLEKLNWALRQGVGYVGITTFTGSRFTTDTQKLRLVMQTLRDRGLMMLDAHVAPHSAVTSLAHEMRVPVATVNERIDENLSPEAIDSALQQLEQAARLNGRAVGVVAPLPIVIDHLEAWLKTLPDEGIALAPVSAVVQ